MHIVNAAEKWKPFMDKMNDPSHQAMLTEKFKRLGFAEDELQKTINSLKVHNNGNGCYLALFQLAHGFVTDCLANTFKFGLAFQLMNCSVTNIVQMVGHCRMQAL